MPFLQSEYRPPEPTIVSTALKKPVTDLLKTHSLNESTFREQFHAADVTLTLSLAGKIQIMDKVPAELPHPRISQCPPKGF